MAQTNYLLCLLDAEWQQLITDSAGRRRLAEWQATHLELSGSRTIGELVDAIDASRLAESTTMVWALLELADADVLARRVMLQVIVPGLAGEARWVMNRYMRGEPDGWGGAL